MINLIRRHAQAVHLGAIISFQAQMRRRHRCDRARCANDLKPLTGLLICIRGKIGQAFLKMATHQCITRSVIFHITEIIAQGGHPQRDRNPIHHLGRGKWAVGGVKACMQTHDRSGAFPFRDGG